MNGSPPHTVVVPLAAAAGSLVFVASLGVGIHAYVTDFGGGPAAAPGDAAAIDVLLFTVFALHHSLFARTGLKRRIASVVSPALERSVYVWIASLLFIGVCLLWRPVPGEVWRVPEPWAPLATSVQIAGVLGALVASRQLDVLALAGLRQAMGWAVAAPSAVVDGHLYRVVRHPIYLAWVLMVWPTPVMTGTRLVFALTSTLYLAVAIPFEERSLREEFGLAYDDYAARVRWRMIPFVY